MKKALAAASLLTVVLASIAIAASRGDAWTPEQIEQMQSL